MATSLDQTQLITDLLLLVREERSTVAGEDSKSTVEVGEKRDIAFEFGAMVDEGATDAFKRSLLYCQFIVELSVVL